MFISFIIFILACQSEPVEDSTSTAIEKREGRQIIAMEDSLSFYHPSEEGLLDSFYANIQKYYAANNTFPPEQGIVPDMETAAKIAEAIWLPLYGETILEQRPYQVRLEDDSIWIVHGNYDTMSGAVGLIVHAKIRKSDGKVILVAMEK